MYNSRFRRNDALISGKDICDGLGPRFIAKDRQSRSTVPLPSPFDNQSFEHFLSKYSFCIACDVKDLSYVLDFHDLYPQKIGAIEREYFEDTYAASQHALAAIAWPSPGATKSIYREHCWRVATLIYFNTGIRNWQRCTGVLSGLIRELTNSLHCSDLSAAWSPFSDVLLWVLFLGHFGAYTGMEKGWFGLEISRVMTILDVESFEHLESILKQFLYRDSIYRGPLVELWEEIR